MCVCPHKVIRFHFGLSNRLFSLSCFSIQTHKSNVHFYTGKIKLST